VVVLQRATTLVNRSAADSLRQLGQQLLLALHEYTLSVVRPRARQRPS